MFSTAIGARLMLRAGTVLSLIGLSGVLVTLVLGFEEADSLFLAISAALMVCGPGFVLLHLLITAELSKTEKREVFRALISPHATGTFSDYISSQDRRLLVQRLRHERERRLKEPSRAR